MVNIEERLTKELDITLKQVQNVIKLLDEGNTVPFISRYRKEQTGGLSDDVLRKFFERLTYLRNLKDRKEDVLRLIDEQGKLNDDIVKALEKADTLTEVDDIYRPYKQKKRTRATIALEKGLKPLANLILEGTFKGDIREEASKYIDEEKKVLTVDEAISGALDIVAECISDDAGFRKWIRELVMREGKIESKGSSEEPTPFEMYYDFSEPVKYLKHYRCLAINRAEKEGVISVKIEIDLDKVTSWLESKIIKNANSFVVDIVKISIKDSLKRLIIPSIERDIRSEITSVSEEKAIETFSSNLYNLLLTRGIKGSNVIGFDPAFRTGCKLAVIDMNGNLLDIAVIYPHEPKNDKIGSAKTLRELINKYNVKLISIGNGTASRESEAFVSETIKGLDVKYIITNEAGASVYSASKLAIEEFPDLTVEKRSAISIARRVEDPLSELVKIDPKSIGVGEYQHDVNQSNLSDALKYTVESVVNKVGVNLNTASSSILSYISGLTKKVVTSIMDYKVKNKFNTREELKNVKGVTPKVYEQAIGFLRVPTSTNILDNTGIHPENYNDAKKVLDYLKLDISDIYKPEFKSTLTNIDVDKVSSETKVNAYTLADIIKELLSPGLDPRDELPIPFLKSNILTINDLTVGMELTGTVRNVTSFGAFIDIGLHDDALVHISKMSKSFVSDAKDILSVGEIIKCYVDKIDKEKGKVNLSLIKE